MTPMEWTDLPAALMSLLRRECMVQVWRPKDEPGHMPVLTAIGTMMGGPGGAVGSSDAITLTLTTGTGGVCGVVLLREKEFVEAKQYTPDSLTITYTDMVVGLTSTGEPDDDAEDPEIYRGTVL
jgi:hypothetical protein